MADQLGQPLYYAEKETEAQGGAETCQGYPVVGDRPCKDEGFRFLVGGFFHCPNYLSSGWPPLPWASPFSVCCVFCCCVVRFKNGQGSNLDGGNYHVYENGSLEIKMIRKEDQGIYTCVATNILGKAENQVRLEVKGKGEG